MLKVEEKINRKFGQRIQNSCEWSKMNDYFKRIVHQIIVTRPLEISKAFMLMLNAQLKVVYLDVCYNLRHFS